MRELLDNYNNYLAEIKKKNHAIKKLELEEVTISGSNFAVNGDLRPKGYMTSNLEKKVIDNADKINKLKKEIEELQAKIEMIDSLINNTLDDLERKVITLIFKNKYDKTRVAKKIYMSRANVYVILNRAIEKMNKKIDTN
jgi:DNA-directed RNA polymerase specialized sigma subunit